MENKDRIYIIDLFRFIAALSVVFFHYAFLGSHFGKSALSLPFLAPIAKYGFLGVELFFIISGFVILMSAWDADVIGFLSSRVGRLYPAYWVCCTLTTVVLLISPIDVSTVSIKQYLINMTMLNGFVNINNIDGSYWTLMYEITFYALIAFVLLIRKIKYSEYFAYIWLTLSIACIYLNFGSDSILSKIANKLTLGSYSSLFIYGMLLFLIWKHGLTISKSIGLAASCGLSIYSSVNRAINNNTYSNYDLSIPVVVAIDSFILIIMFLAAIKVLKLKKLRIVSILGALSYPLYLLHHTIGYAIFNQLYNKINTNILVIFTFTFMFILSFLVSHYIESKWCKTLRTFIEACLRKILRTKQFNRSDVSR